MAKSVFPKRPGQKPEPQPRSPTGTRRTPVGARLDDELQAYVDETKTNGTSPTLLVVRSIALSKDVSTELGQEWWEVERRANVEGVRPGVVLARLAKAQLELERGKGRK